MLGDQFVDELESVIALAKPETTFSATVDAVLQVVDGVISVPAKLRSQCKYILDSALEDAIRLLRPRSGENKRLINQRGLFTYSYGQVAMDDWVKEQFKSETRTVMVKVTIPESSSAEVLAQLYNMNINHATLFPD